MVMIFGEITTSAKVDYEKVVRDTCREIGFTSAEVGLDADTCKVRTARLAFSDHIFALSSSVLSQFCIWPLSFCPAAAGGHV